MTPFNPVPDHYLGVWQRLSLESAAGVDTATRVYWLQTLVLHADIRVPADRPDFREKHGLQDLTIDELRLLARQQGFAGVTLVEGDTCLWRRHIDYQPPTGGRDIGRMAFDNDRIVEDGLESSYREVWQRLPDSTGETIALRFLEEHSSGGLAVPRKGYLVASGDYFIFARDRAAALPRMPSLAALLEEPNLARDQIIDMLDFEISFGRRQCGRAPWEIQLSTLPFREGRSLFSDTDWASISQAGGKLVQRQHIHDEMLIRRWSA
ncbi:MAG: hypothetical protein ABIN45_01615 [Gammaproteobacteria bacterium]